MSNSYDGFNHLAQSGNWIQQPDYDNLFGETMANQGNIANEILRQIGSLGDKIDDVETRCLDKVDEVINQLGGPDGVRERLTALEIRMEQVVDNTPASSYPPPAKYRQKKSAIREHGPAAGAGVAITTVVYAIIELVSMIIKNKG